MEDCIFCKMFAGEVETRRVYEGRDVIGVVDIFPMFAQGQCVVMHRRHVAQFYDLEDEELTQLFVAVKAVAKKIRKAFGATHVSVYSRGMRISNHSHILVYPSTGEGPMDKIMGGIVDILAVRGVPTTQLDEIAEKIRTA